jgi:phosphate transport system permease protein
MFLIFLSLFLVIFFAKILSYKIKKEYLKNNQHLNKKKLSSLPSDYIYCFSLWSIIVILFTLIIPISIIAKSSIILAELTLFFAVSLFLFRKEFNSKKHLENFSKNTLALTAGIGILITIITTFSILFEALRFFKMVSPLEFFFSTSWNPQMAMTAEQSVGNSAFGIIPVFLGTILITLIAMTIAVPVGIMSAIYLSLYAKPKIRDYLKPALEILAGIPTVVYGYFAVITIAPFFKKLFTHFGFEIASESALAAGFVMGVMIIPFILSLTDDALNSVPQSLKDGALAMGSTKSEMIRKVVIPAATPSIIGALILAVSRAIGETMIVVMAAGLVAKLSFNPLDSVTTATAQIVTLLVGDQEFNSPKTLAAFALALTLFVFTFIFNIVALSVIKNFKKKYG